MYPPVHMFGEPDLHLAGLRLWVLARERPEATDYYDGNWLHAHARVEAPGAIVEISGSWLRSDEIARFLGQLLLQQGGSRDAAELSCMEPGLHIEVRSRAATPTVLINITPDHLTQMHRFEFESSHHQLQAVIKDLKILMDRYPVKGEPQG